MFFRFHVKKLSKREMDKKYGRNTRGHADHRTGLITVREGVGQDVVEHEKYHIKHKHPDKPRSPKTFVKQELDAWAYAYKQTGHPHHMLQTQIGLFNTISEDFKTPPHRIITIIGNEIIDRDNIPKEWKDDFEKLKTKYQEITNER